MTARELGIRAARRAARDMLKRWGVKKPEDIRIEAIAKAQGIRVIEGPLGGSRGRLSSGPKPLIRIAEDPILDGARRFTLAHEIAHHVLEHPSMGAEGACASARENKAGDPNQRDYEVEANVFASELLMPRHLVAPRCEGEEPSLEIPRAIAFEFATSIPASAIRYVQLTRDRCAAVYSERGKVEWAPSSRGFKVKIPKGKPLPRGSMAMECARSADVDDRSRSMDASIWFDTTEKVEIVEHSATVSEAGGVITLLWVPEPAAARLWKQTEAREVE
ncbi:MAG TPA: ImmA/IrrE family metallo-endopeptidase [Polyangiales bacterium]|nr:ImmA/IrrE family metallo-endopeptidase [Polyangiales bacterium]